MCIRKDILATLTYFNIFDYPLKKREIGMFLGNKYVLHEFEQALDKLISESVVFRVGEFYSVQNNFLLADRRIKGNEKAAQMLKKAGKIAGFLSKFPFVRGVSVSGSLSKNYADDSADIDFFIITAADRLWIARSFLHLFKKLTFLVNRQHYYCMNYFIDESAPEIIEKNIYTATEIATLLPLRGVAVFENFYAANTWTKNFLPNNYMRISTAEETGNYWFKSFVEWLFNNKAGNLLDDRLMKMTASSWNRKTMNRKKNSRGIIMGMQAQKHYSKPNPANFQQKLLKLYENNLTDVINHYDHSSRIANEIL